jgi:hypothetical protein
LSFSPPSTLSCPARQWQSRRHTLVRVRPFVHGGGNWSNGCRHPPCSSASFRFRFSLSLLLGYLIQSSTFSLCLRLALCQRSPALLFSRSLFGSLAFRALLFLSSPLLFCFSCHTFLPLALPMLLDALLFLVLEVALSSSASSLEFIVAPLSNICFEPIILTD